ncbi:hypothetical protein B0H13DRAFT_2655552 [Mycena leptocephala]|nr:hypothetical protein B0H13DRAFT_2655552 [Mycena leptocephala]
MVPPPLIGDAHGNYRVRIVGNSGVGKEKYGRKAACGGLRGPIYSTRHVLLEARLGQSTNEEMRAKVDLALANAPNGWVVDGNYTRRIGTIVEDSATDVIWLDPPLALYLPRLIWRTFLRLLRLRAPCSPGCIERVSEVFLSKESIVWWCITHHRPVRDRESAKMSLIGVGVGSDVDNQNMRRIGGWGAELRAWFDDVKRMLQRE